MSSNDERLPARKAAKDIVDELRKHPEHWCKGATVRTKAGKETNLKSRYAASWCLMGHILKRNTSVLPFFAEMHKLGFHSFCDYNDAPDRTVQDVIALCRRVANG